MSERNDFNAKIIKEFRENDGVVGGRFKDMRLLLLHTTGAKTGQEHLNPVATIEHGDQYVIVASKGGAPDHPDWYHNLVANPQVTIELGRQTLEARAEVTEEPERTELFNKVASQYPGFKEYERRTERVIPVIKLTPLD